MKYLKLFGKIVKNKKGLDEDFTDTLVATIFIVLIFIFVFVYIYSSNANIKKISAEKISNLEKDYILLNYLRTPLEEKDVTIADYLGSLNKEEIKKECTKKGLLTTETQDILKGITDWRISMYINEEEVCSVAKGEGTEQFIIGETSAISIPSTDINSNIKIYFKFRISSYILPP